MAPEAFSDRPGMLRRALARGLRPLVRYLIAEQVTYPMLAQLLKSVYVDVAATDYGLEGDAPSDSRIALLTGVHRREVKRQRGLGEEADPTDARVALSARLMADWYALPRFQDADGRPVPLNRSSRREGPSIRDLVETAGQDIRPQAILDEWLRLGVVELGEDGRIHLRADAFVPQRGFDEKVSFFGRILAAHLGATAHNLSGAAPPHLDQIVFYGGLTPARAAALGDRARELGREALVQWNREARAAQDADAGAEGADRRASFGAYFFEDRADSEDDDA